MARRTKAGLKAFSDSTYPTNGVRSIEAADVREFNTDAIDSMFMPIASIIMYPQETPPEGWLRCDGTAYNKTAYPDLFAALGGELSPFGVQATTFQVPLIQKASSVIQFGTDYPIGFRGGEETHILGSDEIPNHSHGFTYDTKDDTGYSPVASGGAQYEVWRKISQTQKIKHGTTESMTGVGLAHNNMPPFFVLNFIIKFY